MSILTAWSIFIAGAAIIAIVGSRMTTVADRLADRTGWGEALVGATLLGATTSLPGITASVSAAIDGRPQLAFSNAIGGIAAQTVFLAVADLAYLRANLEHAAASVANMLQATLLIFILALLIVSMALPPATFWGVHPVTPLMFVVYFSGMKMVQASKNYPMWRPRHTEQTEPDDPDEVRTAASQDLRLWRNFAIFAAIVVVCGYGVTRTVSRLADHYAWLDDSAAGALMVAVATSLPELVTSVAAVRRGALTLAVSGIIGGNCFDTLFAAVADLAYRDGSLYHAIESGRGTDKELLLIAAAIAMTGLLLAGLLFRQEKGFGKIGFESLGVVLIYAIVVVGTSIL